MKYIIILKTQMHQVLFLSEALRITYFSLLRGRIKVYKSRTFGITRWKIRQCIVLLVCLFFEGYAKHFPEKFLKNTTSHFVDYSMSII